MRSNVSRLPESATDCKPIASLHAAGFRQAGRASSSYSTRVNNKTYAKPDAMAQHSTHTTDPAWPHFGRDALDRHHAAFTIVAHLKSLGLGGWTTHLLSWLARFDGIEPHIPREHEPLTCVRQILYSFVLAGRHISDAHGNQLKEDVTAALLDADFVKYIAYWLPHDGDSYAASADQEPAGHRLHLWNPLNQSWLSYAQDVESLTANREQGMVYLRVTRSTVLDRAAHRDRLWGVEA